MMRSICGLPRCAATICMFASDTPEMTFTFTPVAFSKGAIACSAIALPQVPPHVASTISLSAAYACACQQQRAGNRQCHPAMSLHLASPSRRPGEQVPTVCCIGMPKNYNSRYDATTIHAVKCIVQRLGLACEAEARPRMSISLAPARMSDSLVSVFAALAEQRRSVYAYLDSSVPRSVIEGAIAIAMLAPNHYRTRPWRFHVYTDGARSARGGVRSGRAPPRSRRRQGAQACVGCSGDDRRRAPTVARGAARAAR